MTASDEQRVERLRNDHDVSSFDSGVAPELDAWLVHEARQSDARDAARVYVVSDSSGRVLGYSALVAGTASADDVPGNAAGGISKVPVVLLGKLAVDKTRQRSGLGKLLLSHAIRTALDARALVALRLLIVDARDATSHDWYVAQGLLPIRDSLRLYARLGKLA